MLSAVRVGVLDTLALLVAHGDELSAVVTVAYGFLASGDSLTLGTVECEGVVTPRRYEDADNLLNDALGGH
jgi:hypothetical protein